MGMFVESVGQYKSTLYETARNLFRSRNTQRTIAEHKTQQAEDLRIENEQLTKKFNSPLNDWDGAIDFRVVSGGRFVFFGAGFLHDFVAVL